MTRLINLFRGWFTCAPKHTHKPRGAYKKVDNSVVKALMDSGFNSKAISQQTGLPMRTVRYKKRKIKQMYE